MTEANKREYVRLYVNYRWCNGIEQQFLALHKGFHEVVPPHHLRPFDERELELVIGEKTINLFVFVLLYNSPIFFQVASVKLILSTGKITRD